MRTLLYISVSPCGDDSTSQ